MLASREWNMMKFHRRFFNWINKRRKPLFISAAILVSGAFVLLNIISYNQAYSMTHFTAVGVRTSKPEILSFSQKVGVLFCGVNVPRPFGSSTPADLGLNFEALKITCSNGIRLGAWHCPVPNSNGLIILFHGYAGDKSSLLAEAARFHALGWSTLLVDFRGSGQSSETYTSVGFCEADDVAEAVRFAQSHLLFSKLVLFGQSMGGAAILRAVCDCGVKPDAVIVESVFDSMLNTVKNRFSTMGVPSFPCAQLLMFWGGRQMNFDTFSHNPADYARNVTCPCLVMHGSDDPRVQFGEAKRVYDAVPGSQKQFKEFKAATHESFASRFPDDWDAAVMKFLGPGHE